MNHEKIYTREDGTKVKIAVSLWVDSFRDEFRYSSSVQTCLKGKRKWKSDFSFQDYQWRRLSMAEREKYAFQKSLFHVTKEEIQEVAIELWDKIKPSFTSKIKDNDNT